MMGNRVLARALVEPLWCYLQELGGFLNSEKRLFGLQRRGFAPVGHDAHSPLLARVVVIRSHLALLRSPASVSKGFGLTPATLRLCRQGVGEKRGVRG